MPEPSAPAPESESKQDKEDAKYLERHPRLKMLLVIGRGLIVPAVVAGVGVVFSGRIDKNKNLTEVGYSTLAPAVADLQKQVSTLGGQVSTLQQLILALSFAQPLPQPAPAITGYGVFSTGSHRVPHAPMPSPPAPVQNQAVDNFKKGLVERVQKSQGDRPVLRHAVPAKLDDAMRQAF